MFFTKLDFSKLKEYGPDARFCGARAPVSGRLCRRGGKFVGMRPLCGALPFVSGRLGRRGENLVRMWADPFISGRSGREQRNFVMICGFAVAGEYSASLL